MIIFLTLCFLWLFAALCEVVALMRAAARRMPRVPKRHQLSTLNPQLFL